MNRDLDEPIAPPAQPTGRGVLGGAVAVSLILHAVVGFALIHRVDRQLEEMEEAPLLVELVPPPEPEEQPPEPEPEEEEPEPEPEPQSEDQAQASQPDAPPPPIPVLRPVYEFAETDTGPKPDPKDLTITQPDQPETDTAEAEESQTPEQQEPAAAEPILSAPQSEQVEAVTEQAEAVERIVALLTEQTESEQEPATLAPEEETDAKVLTPAELLYTDAIREDPTFRTAMNGLPRSRRAGLLCMTEMRDQLRAAQRPPEYLPSFSLPGGTVMEPREAAFRSGGQWFDLAFRCELNLEVTRVLKFSYRIGDAIPRSQWAQRGFPNP